MDLELRTKIMLVIGALVLAVLFFAYPAPANAGIFGGGDDTSASAEASADSSSHSGAAAGAIGVGHVDGAEVNIVGYEIEAASSAASVRGASSGNVPACGDVTGVSGQGLGGGGSIGTVPEHCRAFRAAVSSTMLAQNGYTKRAKAVTVVYWIGLPFRTILHVASFGILH